MGQRSTALSRFGLRDGMTVLELGSGPGFITGRLLRLVPTSLITCVEIDKEIWRLLKPGGKLVICDIDDELFGLFQPPLPEFAPVLKAFGQAQAARGGNRHIGRSLWPILRRAGFGAIAVEVVASDSGERGMEPFLQHIHPDRLRFLVTSGLLSVEDFEAYRTALAAFTAAPEAYTLWMSLMVCGEKPSLV
jgi:SAM-dependent methyltransferase